MGQHTSKSAGVKKQGTPAFTGVVNHAEARREFLENSNPADFVNAPPDQITLGGITYNLISGGAFRSIANNGNTEYASTYQASQKFVREGAGTPGYYVPDSEADSVEGEYPLFQVVVEDVRRRKTRRFEFNPSIATGTGYR